jgi:hypothetical protein
MPLNPTKNQHYISQAEQRLNAIDPSSPKRIFALAVIDRDKHILQARDPRGSSIEKSLSYHDLFSLDVISPNVRNNLEDLFQRYEKDVSAHSQALLAKLDVGNADLKKEVINLFCAKLMNFQRNPFCIRKALNTFGSVASYHFTDRALATELAAAIKGSRPQRDGVCAQFNIASDEYDRWLKVLFLLLTKAPLHLAASPCRQAQNHKSLLHQRVLQRVSDGRFVFADKDPHTSYSLRLPICVPLVASSTSGYLPLASHPDTTMRGPDARPTRSIAFETNIDIVEVFTIGDGSDSNQRFPPTQTSAVTEF